MQATTLEIDGKSLKVSNLGKVLYPEVPFSKGEVIDYYIRISEHLLPHLRNRALTLKRYPNGVEGPFFYEKRCPSHRPDWVETAAVYSKSNQADVHYCMVNGLPTLVWAANLADLELHTSLSYAKTPLTPSVMVFDLDPGPPADLLDCCQIALRLKRLFDRMGLQAFPKTSGSKGMQIYVPFNEPRLTYDKTKSLAQAIASGMRTVHPTRVVDQMSKSLRKGKIFIDWSQNDDHKTTVCVYSLRAKSRPTVSTPLEWKEVEGACRKGTPSHLVFESHQVVDRVAQLGDLFAPVLTLKQKFPRCEQAEILEWLREEEPLVPCKATRAEPKNKRTGKTSNKKKPSTRSKKS